MSFDASQHVASHVLFDRQQKPITLSFDPSAYRDFDDMTDHLVEAIIRNAINRRSADSPKVASG